MSLVIKTHQHPPLPVEMHIVVPSVHPPSHSDLGVSNEVDTCIPSPVTSLGLNDVTTCISEVWEAVSCVDSALSHAYSIQHDIKLHPPDKINLNSPQLLVLPQLKAPSIKWPQFSMEAVLVHYVQHCTLAKRRNICHLGVTRPLVMRTLFNLWLVP